MRDPHFEQRGLFAHKVASASGSTIAALPVPVDPQFRGPPDATKPVPSLEKD